MAVESKRPLKVFLCHASGDKLPVRELYKHLITEGVDAWLDQEKLLPGQDWRVEIPRAVRESDVVVICLSNRSITKEGYIQKEIKFALDSAEEKPEGTIFLIPARLEDCPVPERLSEWQWVDMFEENGFVRLLRSLKLRATQVGATVEPASYVDSDKEREHRLEQLYTEGLAAFYTEDWDKACRRFQSILNEQPNHKNAAEKLAEAERQRSLARLYTQATEAYQAENWLVAIQTLDELSQKSAAYKDVAQLLGNARKQKQLRELYAEAKTLHTAQKWQAVVKVFEQVSIIEPNYPDPDGLLTSAQKGVAELKRLGGLNDLYSQGLHKMDAGQWYEARNLLEQVHKAQIGFLDTERLLRKVENEIIRVEELNKRRIHINALYEQAHGLVRSKNWRRALDKIEEIQKLGDQFVDKDGIFEKAKAGLEREEQEAQRQKELGGLYARAVSLLEAKKYQEALEKWNAIQAIDPSYKDGFRVKKTAKRKLDELAQPEAVGRPWLKIISDWFRFEANIPVEREILSEKLLLLSFAATLIIGLLYSAYVNLFHISQAGVVARCLSYSILGGLFGTVLAFTLNKAIYNWQLKQSLAVIIGWFLSYGLAWIIWEYYFARNSRPVVTVIFSLFVAIATIVAMIWARPPASSFSMIIIFVGWVLAWNAGDILYIHLAVFNNDYASIFVDALVFLLGLLFTFGIQIKEPWEVLKTALFGALGFAVGNCIAYYVDNALLSLPSAIVDPLAFTLWGLIGGAILEISSRNSRRILLLAAIGGVGLLVGYYIAFDILPLVTGPGYLISFPGKYVVLILRQAILGIALGLAFGLWIRRISAIGILTVLGAGIYMISNTINIRFFDNLDLLGNIARGALIGLVMGYGYGYMRKAKSLTEG